MAEEIQMLPLLQGVHHGIALTEVSKSSSLNSARKSIFTSRKHRVWIVAHEDRFSTNTVGHKVDQVFNMLNKGTTLWQVKSFITIAVFPVARAT